MGGRPQVYSTFYHHRARPVNLKCSYGGKVELPEDVHVVKATLGCDKNKKREKSENVKQAVQQMYDAEMRAVPANLLSSGKDLSCRCCPDGPWLSVTICKGPASSRRSRSADSPPAESSGRKCGNDELNPRDKEELQNVLREHGLDVTAQLVLVDALDAASARAVEEPDKYHPPDAFTIRTIGQTREYLMRHGILKKPQRLPKQLNLTCPRSGCLLTMLHFLMSRGKEYVTGSSDDERDQNKKRFEMELNSVCFYLGMPEALSRWCALRGARGASSRSPCCVLLHAQEIEPQHLKKWAIMVCNPPDEPKLLNLQPEVSEAFKVLERTGASVAYADSSEGMPAGDYDAIYVMGHLNVKGSPGAAALLPKGRRPPRLAICNGCASEQLAMELHEAGVHFVVCWDAEVPDVVAATFGRELLMRLAKVDGSIGKFQIGEAFKAAISRVPWEAIPSDPILLEDGDDDDVPVATGADGEYDPPAKAAAAKQARAAVSAGGSRPVVVEVDDPHGDAPAAAGGPASARSATAAAEDAELAAMRAVQQQQRDDEAMARALQREYDACALQRASDEAVARALQQAPDDEPAADAPRREQVDRFELAVAGLDLVGGVLLGAGCSPAAAGLKRAAEGALAFRGALKRARLAS